MKGLVIERDNSTVFSKQESKREGYYYLADNTLGWKIQKGGWEGKSTNENFSRQSRDLPTLLKEGAHAMTKS